MSCIVYQTNKNTGTKYAYKGESYRDPKTGTPKSRRTYLGRVDPETGDIIPKAARDSRNTCPTDEAETDRLTELARELRETRETMRRQALRIAELEAELAALRSAVARAGDLIMREASSGLDGTQAG